MTFSHGERGFEIKLVILCIEERRGCNCLEKERKERKIFTNNYPKIKIKTRHCGSIYVKKIDKTEGL